MEKIRVFDTTLRDGEQAPGASMTVEHKLELARQIASLGVDAMEAGFPVSSAQQFKACRLIAENVRGSTITALARCVQKDIDAAAEALTAAENSRIHVFISTSPIHMRYKLKMEPDKVIEQAIASVKYAAQNAAEVEFSPEDASRSDVDFLCRIIEKVIDAGATIINIPDTVGYALPNEFGGFIGKIMAGVANMDKAVLSVHCHNDLGLAVANSLAGVLNGARQVEVTINGIGERAGNAALEELVMALNVRSDALPYSTSIKTDQIYRTSRLLANIIATPIPRNKPIVGDNAFAHESGIHQDGMLKNRETYEIMKPETIGREFSSLVLGRHSGLHGFKSRLTTLGLMCDDDEAREIFDRFLELADKKTEVYDEDILTLVNEKLGKVPDAYRLDYIHINSGNTIKPTATVGLSNRDKSSDEAATGDGPVAAAFNAIDRIIGLEARLKNYSVYSVTSGKQALGEVAVEIEVKGRVYYGKGASTDILEASAKAYVNGLNRCLISDQQAG